MKLPGFSDCSLPRTARVNLPANGNNLLLPLYRMRVCLISGIYPAVNPHPGLPYLQCLRYKPWCCRGWQPSVQRQVAVGRMW